ncbi:putative endonuclease [Aquiflexum balticum DSM 16537]|uniref:Putative endonuclease n=1 Tax=Aquiflexum balticum DSM 16537 TaxID=758820 RepID=A0A1W2GYS8_9BACT|nr:GIY-YIG nuclease family protein [Aquiflexum balticum]SMD41857.1 putative endonuclease [Aquiflexum balticum DSM 16537]
MEDLYFVYIIYSPKINQFYIGSTNDLEARLRHHNSGATPSTKKGAPEWTIRYIEDFQTKSDALKREIQIKRKKSRKYIDFLISSAG